MSLKNLNSDVTNSEDIVTRDHFQICKANTSRSIILSNAIICLSFLPSNVKTHSMSLTPLLKPKKFMLEDAFALAQVL